MNFFAYGTLMCPDIIQRVTGETLTGEPAQLDHFRKRTLKGENYPGIIPAHDETVGGTVYYNLSSKAFGRLDLFEGDMYFRQHVDVKTDNGTARPAATYVLKKEFEDRLSEAAWHLEWFIQKEKASFEASYFGFDELRKPPAGIKSMTDAYLKFEDLQAQAKKGLDYEIVSRKGRSAYAVMAPHGGAIEPGTTEIAEGVAGKQHAFYTFKGIRSAGNAELHLTSSRFDEPEGRMIASQVETVLTIHGCQGSDAQVYVGGRQARLVEKLVEHLNNTGFQAVPSTTAGLRGVDRNNLCNGGRLGAGVQLELTRGLRQKMFPGLDQDSRQIKTALFDKFITAVREVLAEKD